MVLKAQLTFVEKEGTFEYGKVDERVYTLEKVNEIAAWLLDSARCNTSWDALINIRAAQANSSA